MDHRTLLIGAIAGFIVLAVILGALVQRLRISPPVGVCWWVSRSAHWRRTWSPTRRWSASWPKSASSS